MTDTPRTSVSVDPAGLPWIPIGPGQSFKPLRFMADGRSLLLRLEPGVVVPLHRHTGEVHAYNVTGFRRLDTDEVIGPGGYVYEPAGNVDSWVAVGEEPVIVHIVAFGAMQYLDPEGNVLREDNAQSLRNCYVRFCEDNGVTALELE